MLDQNNVHPKYYKASQIGKFLAFSTTKWNKSHKIVYIARPFWQRLRGFHVWRQPRYPTTPLKTSHMLDILTQRFYLASKLFL